MFVGPALILMSILSVGITGKTYTARVGRWHTEGNQILDAQNQPVRIAGISWFGLETTTYAPHGLWLRRYTDMLDQIKQTGYNSIRLPFCSQLFDADSIPNGIDPALNPDLIGLTGLEVMDKIIDYGTSIGLHFILDRHRPDSNGQSELWYTACYSESRWIADWVMLAKRYLHNPLVIGADLHNEPHGIAEWGSGDPRVDWRLAAENAGNAILEVNPHWLIFVEGIERYGPGGISTDEEHGGIGYWWGGNLMGVAHAPVRLNIPGRVVYSPHDYPATIHMQKWFSAPDYPNNLPALWDSYWGYIYKQNIAPIWLGEFGTMLEITLDHQWLQTIVQYLGTGNTGMNWTFWSWNPNSGDTGGILSADWLTIEEAKQAYLYPVLSPLEDVAVLEPASEPVVTTLVAFPKRVFSGIALNVGSTEDELDGFFLADRGFNGGEVVAIDASIDTSHLVDEFPEAIYRSARYGSFIYTIPNLKSGVSYKVRLHFAEFLWTEEGQRVFDVSINGELVLKKFDIVAEAHGSRKAFVKELTAIPDSSGIIIIQYSPVIDHATCCSIEILPLSDAALSA